MQHRQTNHMYDSLPKLYVRKCACGCGKTFLTTKDGPSKYWSRFHEATSSSRSYRNVDHDFIVGTRNSRAVTKK